MMVAERYRTSDLAKAIGVSVQQVRVYEERGWIPPVARSEAGYRLYGRRHLEAIQTAAHLMRGFGRARAEEILRAVYEERGADAMAALAAGYAHLERTRLQLEQTMAALRMLTDSVTGKPPRTGTAFGAPARARRLRVGEAAQAAGVRVSAVRFWEQQGLLHPLREKGSGYRLYDEQQLRRLRIVALLRRANHDFPAIRATLAELEGGKPQRTLAAVVRRRHEVAAQSWHCMQATARLYAYICQFEPGVVQSIESSCLSFDIGLE